MRRNLLFACGIRLTSLIWLKFQDDEKWWFSLDLDLTELTLSKTKFKQAGNSGF